MEDLDKIKQDLKMTTVPGLPEGLRISRKLSGKLYRAGWFSKDYTETEGLLLSIVLNTLPRILDELIFLRKEYQDWEIKDDDFLRELEK
jgi:hypothetical protein